MLVAAVIACSLPAAAQNVFTGRVTRVERGDQIVVQLDTWQLTVRLHGAECPPEGPLSPLARAWVEARLRDQKVTVQVRGTAARGVVYGDVLCPPNQSNIGVELIREGLAIWAKPYSPNRADLAATETEARRALRGVWGDVGAEQQRLGRRLRELQKAPRLKVSQRPRPKATPTPPTPSPTPPRPVGSRPVPPPTRRGLVLIPLLLGVLLSAGLLAIAERLSRDARRLLERAALLTDAREGRWMKVRGQARPTGSPRTSVVGRIPALYLHERTQVYRDSGWQTTYDEMDRVPFVLDDGLDQAEVPVEKALYHTIRAARFYNDVPVEQWHVMPYSGDVRTEILFIPPDVTLTVYGAVRTQPLRFESPPSGKPPITIIEGDERRLTRAPIQVALWLVLLALGALSGGIWLSVWGPA